MYYSTAILSLLALVEAAGPHHGSNRLHRRHHARAALSGGSVAPPPLPVNLHVEAPAKRDDDSCTHGDWNCVGSDLQRCVWGDWTSIRNCTGDNIVCSTQDNAIGCVWTWNVDSSATPTSGAESATASLATVTGSLEYNATSALSASEASATASQVANSTLTGAIAAASPTTTGYASNVTSTNSTTTDEDDEDCDEDEDEGEDEEDENKDCDDDDEDYTSTSSVVAASSSVASQSSASSDIGNAAAYATAEVSSSPTASSSSASASASGSSEDDDDEDSDYDEDEDDEDDSDDDDEDDDEEEDDENCDDEDDEVSSSSASVSASAPVSSSFNSSVPPITASATSSASFANETDSASTANATETPAIGDGLYAPGQDSTSSSASETAWDTASSSSSETHWWNSWNTKSSSASEASATASGSESTSSTDSWSSDPTASSSSSDADSWNWWGSSSSNTKHHKSSTTDSASTASASQSSSAATASASSSASSNTSSNNTSSTTWSAPHYVIYADEYLSEMPSASELSSYNRFILAFWQYDGGAVDDVQTWADFDESYRNEVITEYHNAGIALMISAFGSEDTPTTSGADAKTVAQDLAAFVQEYNLDGVDIDYEDMSAMNSAKAAAWIITLQTELRSLLPSPYIISHAPVAPWFTSASDYSDGSYVTVHQSVGDTIDFYSVQYYNQGDDQYVSCDTLITNSGSEWPSTSVFELNSYSGIPLEKIVIGKPLDSSAADNGFMSAADLAVCVAEAIAKGWNGGVMFWEWTSQAPSVMATVRG
ncbi:hypothetical protein L198_03002 [Cryptococcus wingfieldii CBS 7118]|uniref:GH18 domain-containing protein n=1 Tax=Cryptococcus wingfieldii CBS 7118 TaxID=1295528 RepID=A0A1E3JKN3_9TREE|nr:hypothetical protein L198_03002 [Cryptococcus wingfieldii CBS 7118]ODO00677.1 hypothetical protein L198_03002 [Cryptococcus wingfieldii CBS 7118]